MATYYYLYSEKSVEFLTLGKRVDQYSRNYQGPVIWLKSGRYYLPTHILNILIKAFKRQNSDAVILADYDLFDSGKYLTDERPGIEIGGDTDIDIPLTRYLPELEFEEIQKEIESHKELKIN